MLDDPISPWQEDQDPILRPGTEMKDQDPILRPGTIVDSKTRSPEEALG